MTRAAKTSYRGVRRDPHYRKILEGLERNDLSEDLFESCAADLLRDTFPGLVPVPGGSDAGFDGAIARRKGEPIPLVITTGDDPERNLRKSLDAILRHSTKTQKVAFATSRKLTPTRRRRLMELARQKGFTMLQVIEQRGIADRLYRDSRWARDLLGVAGTPPALSVVPSARRPLLEIEPIGRERDVEWIRKGTGDRVLVGQPGAGKTFLLYWLVRRGWDALFLRGTSETEIANSLRDLAPKVVIVDDAHARLEDLRKITDLRRELGLRFEIVATTWEGARDRILAELSLTVEQSHKLELLTRREILAIYEAMGIPALVRETVRDAFLRELVDQAGNKPGLAVTIGTLWLQGGWQEIVSGAALAREMLRFLEQNVGVDSTPVLGCLSLGGRRGMRLDAAGELLGINMAQIWRIVTDLSAGGMLRDLGEGALAVEPEPLRSALLRVAFFPDQGPRLDYRCALGAVESREHAVEALLQAKGRGVAVPDQVLHELVAAGTDRNLWEGLASISRENALWVLANYHGDVVDIARGALHHAASAVLPRLISASRRAPVMALLSTWIKESEDGAIERRRWLALAARDYLAAGGNPSSGMQSIFLALSPEVEIISPDPAMGDATHFLNGLLPAHALREIEEIWNEVRDSIERLDAETWLFLQDGLWGWIFPETAAKTVDVPQEEEHLMKTFAVKVLSDLSHLARESPGVAAGLTRLASHTELPFSPPPLDPLFELLYPPDDLSYEAQRERETRQRDELSSLASRWVLEPPGVAAQRLAFYAAEARRIHARLDNTAELSAILASLAPDPSTWFNAFQAAGLAFPTGGSFLREMVERRHEGWEERLAEALDFPATVWIASSLVLTLKDPPQALLSKALAKVRGRTDLVLTLCLQRRVPMGTLRELLGSPDWEVALAAAAGEWASEPKASVRDEVMGEWREAVLRSRTGDYRDTRSVVGTESLLKQILASDRELAEAWLDRRLADPDLPSYLRPLTDSPFATAVRALGRDQRRQLLSELRPAPILRFLVPELIGRDVEMYRALLARNELRRYALEVLRCKPDEPWKILAVAALEAGLEPAAIAETAIFDEKSYSGPEVEHWREWVSLFEGLEGDSHAGLRKVGRHGRRIAQERLARAEEELQLVQLHGLVRR